jgi:hypothetical protein
MALANDLSFQAVGLSDKGMASLPVSSHSHSPISMRGRNANAGRGNNCLGPTFCCNFNEIEKTILVDKCQDGQIPECAL